MIIEDDIKDIVSRLGDELHQLEGQEVVITGASGMLASYLVYTLLYANENVFKHPATLHLVMRKNTKYIQDKYTKIHLLDIAKEVPSIPHANYIIHAASKAAPKLYDDDKVDTLNTNILGLYNLLANYDSHLKSFLFFSSSEIYGSQFHDEKVKETFVGTTNHLDDRGCYREAKKICETICMNYFWERKLPVKIARIFHTFGPGLNLTDGRIFSDFIQRGLKKEDIIINGDPTMRRSLLYIKDATIMFFKLLLSNRQGEVYNVGNDANDVSIKEFADIVASAFKHVSNQDMKVIVKKNEAITYYKQAVKAITPDINKFVKTFSYTPTTTLQEAVERTVKYYKASN